MIYLDTSVLVASSTNEARTKDMQSWLGRQNPAELIISSWVVTEFSAALSMKLRTKQLKEGHRADALATFAELCAESIEVLPVTSSQFQVAARFCDQPGLGLRAGDALHLAIASEHGASLVTLDRDLADIGPKVGVRTLLL